MIGEIMAATVWKLPPSAQGHVYFGGEHKITVENIPWYNEYSRRGVRFYSFGGKEDTPCLSPGLHVLLYLDDNGKLGRVAFNGMSLHYGEHFPKPSAFAGKTAATNRRMVIASLENVLTTVRKKLPGLEKDFESPLKEFKKKQFRLVAYVYNAPTYIDEIRKGEGLDVHIIPLDPRVNVVRQLQSAKGRFLPKGRA
jgi:hypothetical protein